MNSNLNAIVKSSNPNRKILLLFEQRVFGGQKPNLKQRKNFIDHSHFILTSKKKKKIITLKNSLYCLHPLFTFPPVCCPFSLPQSPPLP